MEHVAKEAANGLTIRRATEADVPALSALWSSDAGWGELTVAQWREWYEHTPYGPCLVFVAVQADGAIIGQIVGTPSRVIVDGVERKAVRLSAPIIRTSDRQLFRRVSHPVVRLYLDLAEAAIAEGVELMYSVPDVAWVDVFTIFRRLLPVMANFETARFSCRSLDAESVAAGSDDAVKEWHALEFERFDDDFDALWSRTASAAGWTAVVRRASWLQFKLGEDTMRVALRDGDGLLVGYVAVRERDGLLLDLFARDASLHAALLRAAATAVRAARVAGRAIPAHIKVMETDMLRDALDALGAQPVNFTFALAVAALPGGPPSASVAPDRWLVSGGD